jgi:hypothetical protein
MVKPKQITYKEETKTVSEWAKELRISPDALRYRLKKGWPMEIVMAPRKMVADFPHLVQQWHPTKNGDLKPENVPYGSLIKVWWKCYDGKWPDGSFADDHEWEATPNRRAETKHCPCCQGVKAVLSNCLATTHPEIAKQWHPTKNGNLKPEDVTFGYSKKVWWKCYDGKWPDGSFADDHEWEAVVSNRTNSKTKTNCPCCNVGNSGRPRVVPSNCLAATHPEIAKQWHPTRNGGLKPEDVSYGYSKKVWWKCCDGKWPDGSFADDHEWEATPNSRTNQFRQQNCPCCQGVKAVLSNCLATTHPEIAKQWHPTRNGDLKPEDVTFGSVTKVWWVCESGHVWLSNPNRRTSKNERNQGGCPICNESKGEKIIREYLEQHQIVSKPQYKFKTSTIHRQPFDESVNHPMFTGLIEYQGEGHYYAIYGKESKQKNFMGTIERDYKKLQWCRNHNIPLLLIPFWDQSRIPEILDNVLAGCTPIFSEPPEIVVESAVKSEKIRDRLGITEPEVLCGLINPAA